MPGPGHVDLRDRHPSGGYLWRTVVQFGPKARFRGARRASLSRCANRRRGSPLHRTRIHPIPRCAVSRVGRLAHCAVPCGTGFYCSGGDLGLATDRSGTTGANRRPPSRSGPSRRPSSSWADNPGQLGDGGRASTAAPRLSGQGRSDPAATPPIGGCLLHARVMGAGRELSLRLPDSHRRKSGVHSLF